jgi:hypothetical protein
MYLYNKQVLVASLVADHLILGDFEHLRKMFMDVSVVLTVAMVW